MIQIPDQLLAAIREHAAETYPNECCGALLGCAHDNAAGLVGAAAHRYVDRIHRVDNRRGGDDARRRFLITAQDYLEIERAADEAGCDIIGFYHSHPDHPARPSDYDRDHAMPWYSYVIVAVERGTATDATSWVLEDDRGRFRAEEIDVVAKGGGVAR